MKHSCLQGMRWDPFEWGGSYDLLSDKDETEDFLMANSKTKRQGKIKVSMNCLGEENV
jgi:hypothetical protein